MLRGGIIGTGRRGSLQAALSSVHPLAEVSSLCDTEAAPIDYPRQLFPDCFFTGDADKMFEKSRTETGRALSVVKTVLEIS